MILDIYIRGLLKHFIDYRGATNITVAGELRIGSSPINVRYPSISVSLLAILEGSTGVMVAFSDKGTSHMRENLFLMGLGCEKYAKLHDQP